MSDLYLAPRMLEEQQQYLMDHFDMTEEEAEEFWEDTRLQVNLTAQEADLDWDKETLDTVTNVIVGIQQQLSARARQHRKRRKRRVLMNCVLHAVLIALGYTAITGYHADGLTTSVLLTITSTAVLFLWLAVGQHVIHIRRP